ncbi:MAG: lysophospholipid acyltransferase family protein [Xenococcaceae cyanobacterium MO_188.B19]|nr:lysophospholipid acyltransferase family protein [Xenococcaceae cyanobacterium MO_188.B19]
MIQSACSSDINKSKELSLNSRVSPWLANLLYPLGCKVVLPLFFDQIKVTGQENIPEDGSVIVAPTHRSRWDALIVPYAVGKLATGRDLRFMVSSQEVKGLQGWFIRRMGGFPVDTERPGMESLCHTVDLLREEEMIVIFPEGGIFREPKVQNLKRGVALMSLQVQSEHPANKVEILPVSVRYNQTYPSWGTKVSVDIGSPINVQDYVTESLRRGSQKLTKELFERLKDLHEIES